ncbi:MAG: lysophospholipid acyltransferase family protein [Kiritimatiellaeota bacterium]|nr:lysophospholipid acyltransferase family protein [Kiritimatiellota bacterium]
MKSAAASFPVYRLTRVPSRLLLNVWNRFAAHGSVHVPPTAGGVIASNHASFLDPPVLGVGIPGRVVRFLGRDTLYRSRFMRWYLPAIGVVPLDRSRGDIGALRKAIQLLKGGEVLGLFPEGTRTTDGQLQPPKGGIGFLIAKAGVPVVPAYVDGTFLAFPRHSHRIKPAQIRVFYGPPIQPAEVAALAGQDGGYLKIGQLVMDRITALKPSAGTP